MFSLDFLEHVDSFLVLAGDYDAHSCIAGFVSLENDIIVIFLVFYHVFKHFDRILRVLCCQVHNSVLSMALFDLAIAFVEKDSNNLQVLVRGHHGKL